MSYPMMSARRLCVTWLSLVALVGVAITSTAHADPLMTSAGWSLTSPDGSPSRQAGDHPDLRTRFTFASTQGPSDPSPLPTQPLRDVRVDLPPGLIGNPTAYPTCTAADLIGRQNGTYPSCPVDSQIGLASIQTTSSAAPDIVPIYNMVPPDNLPALFGMNDLGVTIRIEPNVRASDYGITALTPKVSQGLPIYGVDVTLWGVPQDPSHDPERFSYDPRSPPANLPSTAPRRPFLSNPTSCSETSQSATLSSDFWSAPGAFESTSLDSDIDGTPFRFRGCSQLPFSPSADVSPLSTVADSPTGLNVDVTVPQNDSADSLATAQVRQIKVTLPDGFSVSPSSAAGLGACAPDQIQLGTDTDPTCPNSSKIGTVDIDTPLLADPLRGDVILAKQDDNPFKSMIALYIVARGPGFVLKLPGRVDLDPKTGRVTTTFDNTPQLPFSHLRVQLRGGSQAPLATPTSCGTYQTQTDITSWASDDPVHLQSAMKIDQGCDSRIFAPSFAAGTTNPAAGASSAFTFTLTRSDRTQYLSGISTTLPPGLLAQIATAPQCPDANATEGTCAPGTEIGSVAVQSGPGAQPLALTGHVYLTGPYKGAPYGLSIVVPTAGQAGPFDLGLVVVRAGISVDRTDAHVTVVSDPIPSIIKGIPLRVRQVSLSINRPGFMFNPTSCSPADIRGDFLSLEGTAQSQQVRFQPVGCGDLDVEQNLAIRFTGKATTDHQHPGIAASVTAPNGTANLKKVVVKLPLSVALDPDNAEALCTTAQRAALSCPKNTIVGSATVKSILPDPLKGPVYFVKGERRSPSGRIISTLPKLWIPLSADGVTIDVNASSDVDDLKRLVTTFDALPDAPFSRFDLLINGGRHGIITVSGRPGTCERDKSVDYQFTGQNGKVIEGDSRAIVEGCRPKVSKTRATSKAVTLRLSGLGAGKLSISGRGVASAHRSLVSATEASIVGRLTAAARRSLAHRKTMKVTLTVRFQPKHGKATSLHKTVTLRRR